MARDTADFAQQSSERAMQAATFGLTWAREMAEESLNQGKHALDSFMKVSKKMAEDFESQANSIREQTTALTEKTWSNTLEYGQKLARAKEPQDFVQCQSEFMARQAQVIADQTREFGQNFQRAAQELMHTASAGIAEGGRQAEQAVQRAEQASKRQRAEA